MHWLCWAGLRGDTEAPKGSQATGKTGPFWGGVWGRGLWGAGQLLATAAGGSLQAPLQGPCLQASARRRVIAVLFPKLHMDGASTGNRFQKGFPERPLGRPFPGSVPPEPQAPLHTQPLPAEGSQQCRGCCFKESDFGTEPGCPDRKTPPTPRVLNPGAHPAGSPTAVPSSREVLYPPVCLRKMG